MPNPVSNYIANHKTLVRVGSGMVASAGLVALVGGAIALTAAFLPHSVIGIVGNIYGGPSAIALGIMIEGVALTLFILSFKCKKTKANTTHPDTATIKVSKQDKDDSPSATEKLKKEDNEEPVENSGSEGSEHEASSEEKDGISTKEKDRTPPSLKVEAAEENPEVEHSDSIESDNEASSEEEVEITKKEEEVSSREENSGSKGSENKETLQEEKEPAKEATKSLKSILKKGGSKSKVVKHVQFMDGADVGFEEEDDEETLPTLVKVEPSPKVSCEPDESNSDEESAQTVALSRRLTKVDLSKAIWMEGEDLKASNEGSEKEESPPPIDDTDSEDSAATRASDLEVVFDDEEDDHSHIKGPSGEPLPKWIASEVGSIGAGHLDYYLNSIPEEKRNDFILWSFSQRKFQSIGSGADTMAFDDGYIPIVKGKLFGPKKDVKGFAVTGSAHDVHTIKFMEDKDISSVIPCKSCEKDKASGVYVGYYEDGRSIIHQPGVRSCVFTSVAMLMIDRKEKYQLNDLLVTNITNENGMKQELKKYGYKTESLKDEEAAKEWIATNGSILASVSHGESVANHQIVIDAIDGTTVTMRDPNHGWRVVVDREKLGAKDFTGIIKTS